MTDPSMIVLAGPNGAGKSTAALVLLRDSLPVMHFEMQHRAKPTVTL